MFLLIFSAYDILLVIQRHDCIFSHCVNSARFHTAGKSSPTPPNRFSFTNLQTLNFRAQFITATRWKGVIKSPAVFTAKKFSALSHSRRRANAPFVRWRIFQLREKERELERENSLVFEIFLLLTAVSADSF